MDIQGGYIFSDWIVGRGEEAYLPFPNKADGFAFRLAYKKFFSNTAPLGNYISAQALFKRISLDSWGASWQRTSEDYNLEKQVLGLKFLVGKQLSLAQSRIIIDVYGGWGIKRHFKYINVYSREKYFNGVSTYSSYNKEERNFIPSIHAGLSIGFGF